MLLISVSICICLRFDRSWPLNRHNVRSGSFVNYYYYKTWSGRRLQCIHRKNRLQCRLGWMTLEVAHQSTTVTWQIWSVFEAVKHASRPSRRLRRRWSFLVPYNNWLIKDAVDSCRGVIDEHSRDWHGVAHFRPFSWALAGIWNSLF